MDVLSREQRAVADFMNSSITMRQITDDGKSNGMKELADCVIQAIASFGASELHARTAERHVAGNTDKHRVETAMKKSRQLNKKGMNCLSQAKIALKQFREDINSFRERSSALPKESIAELHRELLEETADLEIKASDVTKLDKVFSECFKKISSNNPAEKLADYIDEKIDALSEARNRKDRGAVENIPIWKIAAVAVALGIWVWALFKCKWWGSCSWKEGLAYSIIFNVAALIVKFC